MLGYEWNKLIIERHYKVFDGLNEESVASYEYTIEELVQNPVIRINGRDIPDYVLSVSELSEHGLSFFESLRSDNPILALDSYESRGVIILSEGDEHKTPEGKLSYNKSYWFTVKII